MSLGAVGGPSFKKPLASTDNVIEITYAKYDEKLKAYVKVALTEEQKMELQQRVIDLQASGAQLKFHRAGDEFHIFNDGVYHKEGKKWVNLAESKTLAKSEKRSVKSRVAEVAKQLGTVAHTSDKNVRVDVKVVTPTPPTILDKEYREEYAFYQKIEGLEREVDTLQDKGYSPQEIEHLKKQLSQLKEASASMLGIMDATLALFAENKLQEGMDYYAQQMSEHFAGYSSAIVEFAVAQQAMKEKLGDETLMRFPVDQVEHHTQLFAILSQHAHASLSGQPTRDQSETIWKQTFVSMNQEVNNTSSHLQLINEAKPAVAIVNEDMYTGEYGFYQWTQEVITRLGDPEWISFLEGKGYSSDELTLLKEQMNQLNQASEYMLRVLDETRRLFENEQMREGMAYYTNEMKNYFTWYTSVIEGCIIPQKVMEGRLGNDSFLNHALDQPAQLAHHFSALNYRAHISLFGESDISDLALEWNQTVDTMNEEVQRLTSQKQFSKLCMVFQEEVYPQEKRLVDDMKTLSSAIQQNEQHFFDCMRAQGISDLDAHFIFQFLNDELQAKESMVTGLNQVKDLLNQRRDEEALEVYFQLMETTFSTYCATAQKTGQVHFLLEKMDKAKEGSRVSTALAHFFHSLKPPAKVPSQFKNMLDGVQSVNFRRMSFKVIHEGIFENAGLKNQDPASPLVVRWKEVKKLITDENAKAQATQLKDLNETTALTAAYHQIGKAIFNPLFESDPSWSKAIREAGWTAKDIEKLSTISNDYAHEMEPLRRGWIALENESDPIKKRTIREQLKKLADEAAPRLNKITEKYNELGGAKRVGRLHQAITRYRLDADSKLHTQFALFQSEEYTFESWKADYFAASPQARKKLGAYLNPETIALLERIEASSSAVEALGEFRSKTTALNTFFDDVVHLRMQQGNSVNQLLIEGRIASHPGWQRAFKVANFSPHSIERFADLYDQFEQTIEPIYLAHKNLQDDPDNKMLQQKLRNVIAANVDKLNDINKKIREWGGTQKTKALQGVLESFKETMRVQLNSSDLRERQEAELILEELGTTQFATTLKDQDKLMASIVEHAQTLESWDAHYVQSRLLSSFLPKKKAAYHQYWERQLSTAQLTPQDFKTWDRLYDRLNREAASLQKIEQQVSADPGNRDLRFQLKKLVRERKKEISALIVEFEGVNAKLNQTQAVVEDYVIYLKSMREVIKKKDPMSKEDKNELKQLNQELQKWEGFNLPATVNARITFLKRMIA